MYTTIAPKLFENGVATELLIHGLVKTDERDGLFRIIVSFFKVNRIGEPKLTLRFRFKISNGYWSLTSVEVEDSKKLEEFDLIGKPITAPLQFSYKCAQTVAFRSNSTNPLKLNLTLEKPILFRNNFHVFLFKVQPLMNGSSQFGDAYDCVRFTTARNICNFVHISDYYAGITLYFRN